MEALAAGLRGQALLIHRAKDLLYENSLELRVEVDPDFEAGSLVIPVHILSNAAHAGEHILAGEPATALANLMAFLGFGGVNVLTIYALFKKLKGRRIEKPEDVPQDVNITIRVEHVIRIYNDGEAQTQIRKTLEPLHENGIEEFQTRRAGSVVERVSKSDLRAADEARTRRPHKG